MRRIAGILITEFIAAAVTVTIWTLCLDVTISHIWLIPFIYCVIGLARHELWNAINPDVKILESKLDAIKELMEESNEIGEVIREQGDKNQ